MLVERFMENRDATSIQYKMYNDGPEDKYPTFSICFEGNSFLWYNEHQIFHEYGISASTYETMVMGKDTFRKEYIPEKDLYKKVPIGLRNDSLPFDQFHVQIGDFLEVADFKTNKDNNTYYYQDGLSQKVKPPFFIGYQTATMVCFTRQSDDISNLIRVSDSIAFKRDVLTNLHYKNTKIKFISHYPGQLFRSFDTPSFSTSFARYHWDEILSFNLAQHTILRKRHDSNKPCNIEIENQDQNYLLGVSKSIGCIPPYWKNVIVKLPEIMECSTPKQLKEAYHFTQNLRQILPSYGTPCWDVFDSVSYNWIKATLNNDNKLSNITMTYKQKYYEEIKYGKDFTLESFISNVGGFIGMFLGYSLMQLPDFLLGFVGTFELMKKRLSTGNNVQDIEKNEFFASIIRIFISVTAYSTFLMIF